MEVKYKNRHNKKVSHEAGKKIKHLIPGFEFKILDHIFVSHFQNGIFNFII